MPVGASEVIRGRTAAPGAKEPVIVDSGLRARRAGPEERAPKTCSEDTALHLMV